MILLLRVPRRSVQLAGRSGENGLAFAIFQFMSRHEWDSEHVAEVLDQDRDATDRTLRSEREQADQLTATAVADEADAKLATVRAESDVHASDIGESDSAPELAKTLAEAAAQLSEAADGLARAAHTLHDVGEASAVQTLHEVARRLDEVTPDDEVSSTPGRVPSNDDGAPVVAEQLADVAGNLGEVAANLAQERIDADESLREERARLDDVLRDERQTTDETLTEERRQWQRLLEAERRRTDRNLERERADTDLAIERTFTRLHQEEEGHELARSMVVTRDQFLAIVSHDLRTPLSVVIINAAMIADRLTDRAPDLERAIGRVQRAADQMERMLSDLLDATRFEHGQFRLSPRTADVVDVLKETAAQFDELARSHGVTLWLEVPASPIHATLDRDRMTQVLSNLLRNALQFTARGGEIVLRAVPQIHAVRIDVTDTGTGIPAHDLDRIFHRFQQATGSHPRGLGLGLYISRAIVEAHGGRIWVDSAPGTGSTFSFTLPTTE